MKGEEDKGKVSEPMFPRLHVNDRENGEPRAPPRKKMALSLCEQLSVSSLTHRFDSSASSSSAPIPTQKAVTVVSSARQGDDQRTRFAPSDLPPKPPVYSFERTHSQTSESTKDNYTEVEFGRSSKRQATSHHQSDSASAKKSWKNFEDELKVPILVQSTTGKNSSTTDSKKLSVVCSGIPQKSSYINNLVSKNTELNLIEQEHQEVPDSKGVFAEPSNSAKITSNQENIGSVTAVRSPSNGNADLEHCTSSAPHEARSSHDNNIVHLDDCTRVGRETFSEASPGTNQIGLNGTAILDQESERKVDGSSMLQDKGRNEVYEASVPDTIPGMVVCPDDVVGLIGPQHFWKARRAIINQQRIFATQLFELHRLIKVQKLLAASPDIIKVNVFLSHSPREEEVHREETPFENTEKFRQPAVIGRETSSRNPSQSSECRDMRTTGHPPVSEFPSRPFQFPPVPQNGLNPYSFHPQQNQWLVPVMSPSEGLIYKPCRVPCPPTVSFMGPLYGSCAPLSLPPVSLDFMNPACGVTPYLYQPPLSFPPPYVFPMMNTVTQSATTEEVNSSVFFQQSTSNVGNQKSEVTPVQLRVRGSEA